uniref:Uncharacterized protein n=1 Tax=Cucumis melo TaxID=3656 RepID=A0A9I9DLP9_CUCME
METATNYGSWPRQGPRLRGDRSKREGLDEFFVNFIDPRVNEFFLCSSRGIADPMQTRTRSFRQQVSEDLPVTGNRRTNEHPAGEEANKRIEKFSQESNAEIRAGEFFRDEIESRSDRRGNLERHKRKANNHHPNQNQMRKALSQMEEGNGMVSLTNSNRRKPDRPVRRPVPSSLERDEADSLLRASFILE